MSDTSRKNSAMADAMKAANSEYESRDNVYVIRGISDFRYYTNDIREKSNSRRPRYPLEFKKAVLEAFEARRIARADFAELGFNVSVVESWRKQVNKETTSVKSFKTTRTPLSGRIEAYEAEIAKLQRGLGILKQLDDLGVTVEEMEEMLGLDNSR